MKVPQALRPDFTHSKNDAATSHFFTNENPKSNAVIVTMRGLEDFDDVAIFALLTHETVHIFEDFCEGIGETFTNSEFRAYGIQAVSQHLMEKFVEQRSKIKKLEPSIV